MSVLQKVFSASALVLLTASLCYGETGGESHSQGEEVEIGGEDEEEAEPVYAVLFPSFTLTIGVLVFIVLSRYAKLLPYTAVMFLIGTISGIGASLLDVQDQLNESIRMWTTIDSEVLLLVFLPGLIFRDAMGQSVHLFRISLSQLLIYAFPMVLAGTVLTALIAFYIFPYDWSFNLAMTFGSILSATDPVAVAALLNEVGAPPRLKVHVAGESLLNDGSAIVFFSIFSERYFSEMGVPGFGENVDLPTGIAMFAQKALGGFAIGLFFGLGLIYLLFCLDRRFNREENIVEVSATIAVAYIGYYVAEPVFETSGVISTVTTGLVVKFFGRGLINDSKLFDDFWSLVEHLLNTVLFSLGGVVWGAAVAEGEKDRSFHGRDWGFLILLYVLLHVIRLGLFLAVYPVTSRIGLKTNLKETLFQVYGGLRGAVGIALAIALDNEVNVHARDNDEDARQETSRVFGFVGGIAFITLVVNGITAGPLLRWLGLADSTETRKSVVNAYRARFRAEAIQEFVHLTTQPRFQHVNFALVAHHVPHLADLTKHQLFEAVDRYKETTPKEDYHPPNLSRILPYLKDDPTAENRNISQALGMDEYTGVGITSMAHARKVARDMRRTRRQRRRSQSTMQYLIGDEPLSAKELRILFVSILRSAYNRQVERGELEDQQFIQIALEQSLDFAEDSVSNGEKLNDWEYAKMIDRPVSDVAGWLRNNKIARSVTPKNFRKKTSVSLRQTAQRIRIERAIAFMAAHRWAQRFFYREFQQANSELSEGGKLVMQESRLEFNKAEQELKKFDAKVVERTVSHKFCVILLNNGINYVEHLVEIGLLKESEAEEWVEELEEELEGVLACNLEKHPGEIDSDDEEEEDCDSLDGCIAEEVAVSNKGGNKDHANESETNGTAV